MCGAVAQATAGTFLNLKRSIFILLKLVVDPKAERGLIDVALKQSRIEEDEHDSRRLEKV